MKLYRLAAALLLLSTGAMALPQYDIIPLTSADHLSWASDISPNGTVSGCIEDAGGTAFTWKDGSLHILGPGCADAVNDNGLVGGRDVNGYIQFWSGGNVIALGVWGEIRAINSSGVAVGYYYDHAGTVAATDPPTLPRDFYQTPHPFMWSNGQMTALPDGCYNDINDAGQILCQGGIYQNGQMTVIPPPPGVQYGMLSPRDINNRGDVLGYTNGPSQLYADGATTEVPYTGGDTSPVGVSEHRLVVLDGEGVYGFIVEPNGTRTIMRDMPAVIAGGWGKLTPTTINPNDWIVGYGNNPYTRAFLMVPRSVPTTPPAQPLAAAKRGDFNGDTHGDLLWRSGSGDYGIWLMDGAHYTNAFGIASPAAGATVVLRADFDGDGKTDLLWKDAGDTYYVSLVDGTSVATSKVLDGGSGWIAVGSGDFDGDGHADLLWWNASQGYGVWLMNGAAIKQSGFVSYPPTATTPAAIGDFDGSGTDDILWKGDDGHFELYTMAGLAATAAGQVRAAGTGFNVVALGDFNGDHRADIVWGNPDGRQSLWLMNGASSIDSTLLVDTGSGWSVAYAVDLDGDGMSDLVWTHPDGSVGGWLMSGTTMRDYRAFLGAGSGWSLAGTGDLDGNGTTDLVWRYTDGTYGVWLMNGLDATSYSVVLNGGSGWETVK